MRQDRLLTPGQAANYIGFATQTLAQWRWLKTGPPYIKQSNKVHYRRTDLDKWLSARRVVAD